MLDRYWHFILLQTSYPCASFSVEFYYAQNQKFTEPWSQSLYEQVCDLHASGARTVPVAQLVLKLQKEGFGSAEIDRAFQDLVSQGCLEGPVNIYANIVDDA